MLHLSLVLPLVGSIVDFELEALETDQQFDHDTSLASASETAWGWSEADLRLGVTLGEQGPV